LHGRKYAKQVLEPLRDAAFLVAVLTSAPFMFSFLVEVYETLSVEKPETSWGGGKGNWYSSADFLNNVPWHREITI
jgi:hypothetical protein